jgi:hypothetical protein
MAPKFFFLHLAFFIFIVELHGSTAQNKHGAHYAGLIESDEK